MKRYLLFGGEAYYPFGGMWDFIESFDNVEDAKNGAFKNSISSKKTEHKDGISWFQIFDSESKKVLFWGGGSCYSDDIDKQGEEIKF